MQKEVNYAWTIEFQNLEEIKENWLFSESENLF